jgi:phosphate-selective porin OprO and OprP
MGMRANWLLLLGAGAGLSARLVAAQESPTNTTNTDEIKWLRQKVEELERKVHELENANKAAARTNQPQPLPAPEGKLAAPQPDSGADKAAVKSTPVPELSIGAEGFSLFSAQRDFAVQIKGVLQLDSRTFFNDGGIRGNDGFVVRRARPILQGTVFRDFDFLFVPDFGGISGPQIFDAYLNYRYRPELQFRIGKFKPPVGLEQLQADPDTLFNERALASDLVPNRDLGAQLHGEIFKGAIAYAAGIFNGVGDSRISNNADFDDHKAFAGRLFFRPFINSSTAAIQGLGFGLGGSYEAMQGTNLAGLPSTTGGTFAGYTTDGLQQFFAYNPVSNAVIVAEGEHWRLAPQAYYYIGPFGFLGEYVISEQRVSRIAVAPAASATLMHTAWQISGSWVITGEDATYGRVVPRTPFDPREGSWGALQLVARYAELHIDDDTFPLFSNPDSSAHFAASWAVGLNWYLNRNVLMKTSFSHTDFRGGGIGSIPPGNVTRKDESVLFTRVQLAF